MPKAQYDKQGLKFWSLLEGAGWTSERIEKLIWKRYKTSHWNALDDDQKNALIATAKFYNSKANPQVIDREKKLRSSIMAIVRSNGHDDEWLHQLMTQWGFGDSLRKLHSRDLYQVKSAVIRCFAGNQ